MRAGFLLSMIFLLTVLLSGCAARSGDRVATISGKGKVSSRREAALVMLSPDLTAPREPPLSDYLAKGGKQASSNALGSRVRSSLDSAYAQRKAAALQEILRKRKNVSYSRDGRLVIGLLLPRQRFPSLATSMEQAARFALTQDSKFSSVRLVVRDSGDSSARAQRAATRLLREGADIILGPVFADRSHSVALASSRARRVMLTFSNDSSVRGNFVYRFGLSVREQTAVALADGLSRPTKAFTAEVLGKRHVGTNADDWSANWGRRVAIIVPQNAYGRLVAAAGNTYLRSRGLAAERVDFLDSKLDYDTIDGEIRHIADYDYRQLALSKYRKSLRRARAEVAPLSLSAQEIDKELEILDKRDTYGPPPFDILLLPQTRREALQVVSSYLALYDIDSYSVNIYGLTTWGQMNKLWREPQLQGSRYVFPARASIEDFTRRFHAYTNSDAALHVLTALAYDATLTAARLGGRVGFVSRAALEREQGFVGAAGKFRLRPDGDVQRVYEIREITRTGDKTLARGQGDFLP